MSCSSSQGFTSDATSTTSASSYSHRTFRASNTAKASLSSRSSGLPWSSLSDDGPEEELTEWAAKIWSLPASTAIGRIDQKGDQHEVHDEEAAKSRAIVPANATVDSTDVALASGLQELRDEGTLDLVPLDEAGSYTSVGSIGHANGDCKPCAYWFKGVCAHGVMCRRCHIVHSGQKSKRLRPSKQARQRIRQKLHQGEAADDASQDSESQVVQQLRQQVQVGMRISPGSRASTVPLPVGPLQVGTAKRVVDAGINDD